MPLNTAGGADRRAWLGRFFDARNDPNWGQPDAYRPQTVEGALRVLSYVFGPGRYFRTTSAGWEHIPPPPVLLVTNHSGGNMFPDAWGLGLSWYRRFGTERPLHALGHDILFALRTTADPLSRLGVLRARRELALEALGSYRRDVLVLPGGDLETWRPFRDRYTVRWNGRIGYARLALEAGVPIVPLACAGAHSTLVVIRDGHHFARLIGLHKVFRADVFPVHISLPWGFAIGPWPHIPLPVRLRYLVGRPIYPPVIAEPDGSDARDLDRRVRTAMNGLLGRLRHREI